MCTMNAVVLYIYIKQLFLFQDLNDSQELRQVLYDFHIVVKEVVDIKDRETSAHVALISLRKILDSIIDSGGLQDRADLISLHRKVSFLLDFLGNASTYITNQKSELQNLDATIIGAVYKAKNALIELQPAGMFNPDFDWRRFSMEMIIPLLISPVILFLISRPTNCLLNHWGFPPEMSGFFGTLGQICITCASYMISAAVVLIILAAQYHSKAPENQELPQVIDDFSIIERDVIKIKDACGNPIDLPAAASSRQDLGGSGRNVVVGLDSDMEQIREWPDKTPRRLSIDTDALQVDLSHYKHVRSFLCIASKPIKDPSVVYLGFKYLALHYDGSLPPSISKLKNLETIVHHHCSFGKYHPLFPSVIWRMQNLRHLYIKPGCYLFNPIGNRLPWKSFYPVHLQTLVGIRNFKWTQGIIKTIPNLKKLGIWYDVSSSVDWSTYQLETLVDLYQLESLKIIIKYDGVRSAVSHDPPKLAFPQKLKKLTLSGCGIPWASMALIGALPNLKALKLRCEAFSGHAWETLEGEFRQLIFLLLEQISFRWWETDADHFPHLQRLVIRSCGMLEEIPSAVGDIPTLEMIELVDCHPSAVDSAKRIQEEQESMGNEALKFHIDERRREAVEVNIGNLEARGVGAGHILTDVVPSARDEIKLAVTVLLVAGSLILSCWLHRSTNDLISTVKL
ncbi:hypothetical protein C2S51_013569 [Perilla frutescens var. frutescens]|nr:hypothetical protein C2S51_013569 [Perilla frutescens var. frutescens]